MPKIVIQEAVTESDFEQIHRLNHQIFAEEIRQHSLESDGRLVDKFHQKNRYFLAKDSDVVLGMVCVHDQPPFSVAQKLDDPSVLSRLGSRPLEVRLLAITPTKRNHLFLAGLLWAVYEYALRGRYSHLLISGISERLSMYKQMGFEAIGPEKQDGASRFVPMYLDLQKEIPALSRKIPHYRSRWQRQGEHN